MLISQYVNGIYGLPVKTNDSKKSCLHQVLVFMHLYLEPNYIYSEYNSWLDFKPTLPMEKQNKNIFNWVYNFFKFLNDLIYQKKNNDI